MTTTASRVATLTVASTLLAAASTLLPWLRSGASTRNAYGLARAAAALGLLDGWVRRTLLVVAYLVPFLAAASWTAWALGRAGAVVASGAIVGVASATAGGLVWARVAAEPGPVLAVLAGATAAGSAARLAVATARARPPLHETKGARP
jgi:hypothetical protein